MSHDRNSEKQSGLKINGC